MLVLSKPLDLNICIVAKHSVAETALKLTKLGESHTGHLSDTDSSLMQNTASSSRSHTRSKHCNKRNDYFILTRGVCSSIKYLMMTMKGYSQVTKIYSHYLEMVVTFITQLVTNITSIADTASARPPDFRSYNFGPQPIADRIVDHPHKGSEFPKYAC